MGRHERDSNGTVGKFYFSRGGFQEARGSCGKGGHDWMIENVKELLDRPEEWWLDTPHSTLFYYPNNTAAEEAERRIEDSTFVASRLSTLIAVNGTMEHAVRAGRSSEPTGHDGERRAARP